MNFLSPELIIPFLITLAILTIRQHYNVVWKKVYLPFLITTSVLSVILAFIMLYAAYRMIVKTFFSPTEKTLYCLLIAGLIGLLVWLNISNWQKWKNENQSKK